MPTSNSRDYLRRGQRRVKIRKPEQIDDAHAPCAYREWLALSRPATATPAVSGVGRDALVMPRGRGRASELADLTVSSWNQLVACFRELQELRDAGDQRTQANIRECDIGSSRLRPRLR